MIPILSVYNASQAASPRVQESVFLRGRRTKPTNLQNLHGMAILALASPESEFSRKGNRAHGSPVSVRLGTANAHVEFSPEKLHPSTNFPP